MRCLCAAVPEIKQPEKKASWLQSEFLAPQPIVTSLGGSGSELEALSLTPSALASVTPRAHSTAQGHAPVLSVAAPVPGHRNSARSTDSSPRGWSGYPRQG